MHDLGGALGEGSAAVDVDMGEVWTPLDSMEADAEDWTTDEEDNIQKVYDKLADGIQEHYHHFICP
jgi:hypothetical protein